jgi:hypothetical protein
LRADADDADLFQEDLVQALGRLNASSGSRSKSTRATQEEAFFSDGRELRTLVRGDVVAKLAREVRARNLERGGGGGIDHSLVHADAEDGLAGTVRELDSLLMVEP